MSTKKILDARAKTHGNFKTNALISQGIKQDMMLGMVWDELPLDHKEALHMIALKISRICSGQATHKDHWDDIAGYATLVANTLED
jgi:hypothetical protein